MIENIGYAIGMGAVYGILLFLEVWLIRQIVSLGRKKECLIPAVYGGIGNNFVRERGLFAYIWGAFYVLYAVIIGYLLLSAILDFIRWLIDGFTVPWL